MSNSELDSFRGRTWVLLTIDACDRAGLTPISKLRFHRLVFLSNCLADLFTANPPSKRIMKYRRGPFYPDVQWEIDRLITMGLIKLDNMTLEPDEHGPWMEADYGITHSGVELLSKIKVTVMGGATASYIDELVFAFARVAEGKLSDIALRELNYAKPGIAEGALITFEDVRSNEALDKISEFERAAPELLKWRFREQIQLYLRYIEAEAI
jgi:hypothetical protein